VPSPKDTQAAVPEAPEAEQAPTVAPVPEAPAGPAPDEPEVPKEDVGDDFPMGNEGNFEPEEAQPAAAVVPAPLAPAALAARIAFVNQGIQQRVQPVTVAFPSYASRMEIFANLKA